MNFYLLARVANNNKWQIKIKNRAGSRAPEALFWSSWAKGIHAYRQNTYGHEIKYIYLQNMKNNTPANT